MTQFTLNKALWIGVNIQWKPDRVPSNEAIATAEALLSGLREIDCAPQFAGVGYWPTVEFEFEDFPIDVECFDQGVEVLVNEPLRVDKFGRDYFEYHGTREKNVSEAVNKIFSLKEKQTTIRQATRTSAQIGK